MAACMLLGRSVRLFSQILRSNLLKNAQKQNITLLNNKPVVVFTSFRHYAKGKDRKKENKHKTVVNESQLSQVIKVEDLKSQLNRSIDRMKEDFVKNFTLRTSLSALDSLEIEHEGVTYNLQDVAQIGKKASNTYVIDLSSIPQVIPSVLKSIQQSGLGLNPQQEGTRLYVPVPKITKEHRETLAKNAKAVYIRTRDDLRSIQNKLIKGLKNKEGISEDLKFTAKDQITQITDQFIADAEEILKSKQKELTG